MTPISTRATTLTELSPGSQLHVRIWSAMRRASGRIAAYVTSAPAKYAAIERYWSESSDAPAIEAHSAEITTKPIRLGGG